jgi:FeS assembly SUF system protein
MEETITQEDLKNRIIDVIKTIFDPELPVDIWELGLIYDIQVTANNEVVVLMTLTAPNCPEAGGLPPEVEEKLKEIPGVKDVKVLVTFDPPWDKDRLSDVARFELGLF